MNLELRDKTALVLGAGGGLGRAIATSLAVEGARVAVGDCNLESLHETLQDVLSTGASGMQVRWDLSDLSQIDSQVSAIETTFGPIDILINNTGGPPPTLAAGQSPELWTKYFQSMVLSVISLTDRVLPSMRSRGWGRVITSTSSGIITPIPNLAVSNALRLSLVGWSKTLAREVGMDGVTVNVVLPGRVATKRIAALDVAKAKREGRELTEIIAESTGSIPLGRYGNPREYADVVTFLASTRASYMTGSVIRVDGGLIPNI